MLKIHCIPSRIWATNGQSSAIRKSQIDCTIVLILNLKSYWLSNSNLTHSFRCSLQITETYKTNKLKEIIFQLRVPTSDFPQNIEILLSNMRITLSLFLNIIYKLDSHNVSGGDGIPAIVLKKSGPILGPTVFIIFINEIPDVINSQISIYTDNITIYTCLNSESTRTNKFNLIPALGKDI